MYLSAEKYFSDYEFKNQQHRDTCKAISQSAGITLDPSSPGLYVKATIGYWRKANAIHKWFVDHVQDGVDECQQTQVEREHLQELLDLCNLIWKNQNNKTGINEAEQKLPRHAGFFFGSTEMDKGYWDDIAETIDILTRVLSDERLEDCEFYYQSSW